MEIDKVYSAIDLLVRLKSIHGERLCFSFSVHETKYSLSIFYKSEAGALSCAYHITNTTIDKVLQKLTREISELCVQ